MKIKIGYLLLLLFAAINSFAQQEENVTTDVTKATFFYPGISYEKSIGKKSTLLGHAYLSPVVWFSYFTSSTGAGIHADFDPSLQVQYRYYYNGNKRREKGKRIERNSMNYISPFATTTYTRQRLSADYPAQIDRHASYSVGALWGMQRNYQKRFSLDLNMGLQYSFARYYLQSSERPVKMSESEIIPVININLGFWLNRQQKS